MNKKINLLGSENLTLNVNEGCVSEDGLYTLVYVCGPEFYLERFYSNQTEILFTCEPDEYGMYGGLKIGTTKIEKKVNDGYPTAEDCMKAFADRYKSTEDGTSTVLIACCVLNRYISSIDAEVRNMLELIGNFYHPEITVRKSEEIKCGTVNYHMYVFNSYGYHETQETIRKIGKEYMYNISRKDIIVTLSIINSIANNIKFDFFYEDVMKNDNIVSVCDTFYNKLTNHKSAETNIAHTVWDMVRIEKNIIRDIMSNKDKCFVETPLCIIKQIVEMIETDKKRKLSIGIIAKTSDDAINISQNIQKLYTSKCEFTLICSYDNSNLLTNLSDYNIIYINDKTFNEINNMKFDYIIQNPPYKGTLHLDYFDWYYNLQKKNNAKMIIIQPDSIYVDIREAKNQQSNAYRARQMKAMLDSDKSVSKIIIENYNYDFETNAYYPHSITFVDFTKKHKTTDFQCYGYHKIITSILNESNPFGDLKVIESIMKKVNIAFPDKMSNHIAKSGDKYSKGTYFLKYADIIGASGGGFAGSYGGILQKAPALSNAGKFTSIYGDYVTGYLAPNFHPTDNIISNKIIINNFNNRNKEKEVKNINNLFGSKKELENWIQNSTNNILLLFINIIYTWDQNNHTKQIMPWLADKEYSMNDIFKQCKFTKDECEFIVKVVLMYRRDGAYFRRFLLGTNEKLVDTLRNITSKNDEKGIPQNIKKTLKIETDSDIENYIKQCEKEALDYVEGRR